MAAKFEPTTSALSTPRAAELPIVDRDLEATVRDLLTAAAREGASHA
jgi:hypothetical protein